MLAADDISTQSSGDIINYRPAERAKAEQTFIAAADVLVVIVSPNAVASEWVKREIKYARKLTKHIIPIVIHKLPKSIESDVGNLTSSAATIIAYDNLSRGIDELLIRLRRFAYSPDNVKFSGETRQQDFSLTSANQLGENNVVIPQKIIFGNRPNQTRYYAMLCLVEAPIVLPLIISGHFLIAFFVHVVFLVIFILTARTNTLTVSTAISRLPLVKYSVQSNVMKEHQSKDGQIVIDKIIPVKGTGGVLSEVHMHIDYSQSNSTTIREVVLSGDYDPLSRVFIEEALGKVYEKLP